MSSEVGIFRNTTSSFAVPVEAVRAFSTNIRAAYVLTNTTYADYLQRDYGATPPIEVNYTATTCSDLSKWYTLFDFNVENAYIRWTSRTNRLDEWDTLVIRKLKDFLIYAKNMGIYDTYIEFRELAEYAVAMKLLNERLCYFWGTDSTPPPAYSQDNFRRLLTPKTLGDRNLVDWIPEIKEKEERDAAIRNFVYLFSSETWDGFGDNEWAFDDIQEPNDEYVVIRAPITRQERIIYNASIRVLKSLYRPFQDYINEISQLISFRYRVNIPKEYDKILQGKRRPEDVRVIRIFSPTVIRRIYAATPHILNETAKKLSAAVDFTVYKLDSIEQSAYLSRSIGVSIVQVNQTATILDNLDTTLVEQIFARLVPCMMNPNICQLSIVNMREFDMIDTVLLFGILILQELIPAGCVTVESRVYCNNVFVMLLFKHYMNEGQILPEGLQFINSPSDTFAANDQDYMPVAYNNRNRLIPQASAFLVLYLNNQEPQQFGNNYINSSTWLPWCGGQPVTEFNTTTRWNDLQGEGRYPRIAPIIPVPQEELLNWNRGRLVGRLDALTNLLSISTRNRLISSTIAASYGAYLSQQSHRLAQYYVKLDEQSMRTAYLPYADNELYNRRERIYQQGVPRPRYARPIDMLIDVRSMQNLIVFLSPARLTSIPTTPIVMTDREYQISLPLLMHFYDLLNVSIGRTRQAYTKSDRITLTYTLFKDFLPMSDTLFKSLITGSSDINDIREIYAGWVMPPQILSIIESTTSIRNLLVDMRFERGWRDHFWIILNPYFFFSQTGRSRTNFYTNMVVSRENGNPFNFQVIDVMNPLQFCQAVDIRDYEYATKTPGEKYYSTRLEQLVYDIGRAMRPVYYFNWGKYVPDNPQGLSIYAIRVDYPCYVDIEYKQIDSFNGTINYMKLMDHAESIKHAIEMRRPIVINTVFETYTSAAYELRHFSSIDKKYQIDEMVLSVDMNPLPFQQFKPTEIPGLFNDGRMVVRKREPYIVNTIAPEFIPTSFHD